ncbi:MAG: CBS domain-containing protein [Gemmatimonadota bacterium]|nr:CBS domain-containing protein [Gemmatimonadota bacterium]
MRVRELLNRKPAGVVSISPSATTAAAARLLMERGVGGLSVVDSEGNLAGFVSERDIVRLVDRHGKDIRNAPVSEIMRRPAPMCAADDSIRDVMARLTRERLRHLVVMDGTRVAGVISVGDLVKQRLEQLETEAGVLRDYVAGQRARK